MSEVISDECFEDMDELCERLSELAHDEGTELGEAWDILAGMWSRRDCVGDEFAVALEKEIKEQATWVRENCKMIEVEIPLREARTVRKIGFAGRDFQMKIEQTGESVKLVPENEWEEMALKESK